MSDLPVGWSRPPLASLIERIEAGVNVQCEERPPEPGERGLVKISAVTWGRFDELQSKTLPAALEVSERNRIRPGDLLISRANTIELVGASVIVKKVQRRLYLSDKVLRLVVPEPSKRWVNYALKTPAMRKAIEEASSGNQLSMRNISQERLRALTIPLAPDAEQKRIADKLDAVLARVDACRDHLDRVPAILKRFRQSVLAAATRGDLTEDLCPASQTCARAPVPPGWTETTIGAVALDLRYGTSKKCDYADVGIGVLRIPNIADGGRIEASDLKRAEFDESEIGKLALKAGDLLVIRSNGSVDLVGKTSVVSEREEGLLFAGYLIRLRVDTASVLPGYMRLCLAEPSQRQRIELTSKSTSGVNNINADELRALPVKLPPLCEQIEIVRRVDALLTFIDNLEARYTAARAHADRLTPALLAKAFRGELVEQDPEDAPVIELPVHKAAKNSPGPPQRKRPSMARES